MSAVTASIDIDAPPSEVWDVVMNPSRLAEWVTIHKRLESHSDTSMEQVLSVRGVNFHVTWKLDSSDRPRHATWKGKGPGRSRAMTEYVLTEINGGTKFEYSNEFKAPLGALGAFASRAVVRGVSQREADASLRRLKALCEQS